MAGATFRVLRPEAPRRAADPGIGDIADRVKDDVVARTPVLTGNLAAGWQVTKNHEGARVVSNPVPYAKYVEFGTRYMPAEPMIGPVLASHR
jgi:HK97 gp10 family phage protein